MKEYSKRPKSLPVTSKRPSIQRPKSLPVTSKRPFSTHKPIKPPLINSPAKSIQSTNSPLHSSAIHSSQPSAQIKIIHPINLSQYDALLPQTHTYPLKIVAIYYIYLVYSIIYSFCNNITDILKRINDTDYLQPPLFKKTAIEKLIALQKNILKEQYKYKALDSSIIDIDDKYALVEMLVKKITIDTEYNVYLYLRVYLRELKYDNEKIKNTVRKKSEEMYYIRRDDELQSYIDRKIFTPKIRSEIISWFDNINIEIVNNKFKSQFKMIEELINILNDIWVDEKTKGGFIKYILKTQKTSGIQSGGMLSFLRSNRILPETDQVVPMNMRAKTGRTQQIIKLYNSMRTQANRILPEQVLHLNMYRRVYTVNFQNIYDYILLIKSYLFEVDDKMTRRSMKLLIKYYKELIRDDEKEYKHFYKKNMTPAKDPLRKDKSELIRLYERKQVYEDNKEWIQKYKDKQVYKDNKEWIRLYEKKQRQTLLTEEEKQLKKIYEDVEALKIKKELNNLEFEKIYEKIYKEKIDEDFKDFHKKFNIDKKIQSIPTFTEMKQKNKDLIALKLKQQLDMLELEKSRLEKHIRGKHIKFHLETNIKFIKYKVDSVEKDLAHLFP